jgi:hypothetical protein
MADPFDGPAPVRDPTRRCAGCGGEFVSRHGNAKFCSVGCRNAAALERKSWSIRWLNAAAAVSKSTTAHFADVRVTRQPLSK